MPKRFLAFNRSLKSRIYLRAIVICVFACFGPGCASVSHENVSAGTGPGPFVGEYIVLDERAPAHIHQLVVKISLPKNHELLNEAPSRIRLYNAHEKIGEFNIHNAQEKFDFERVVSGPTVFADMVLYYCQSGANGLCIKQIVRYEIPLDPQVDPGDLFLSYTVVP